VSESTDKQFAAVDLDGLKEGMLVDRPLHIYLPKNGRYILLVRPLQPLERKAIDKFRKVGSAFSSEEAIATKYPRLESSAEEVRKICTSDTLAPFEKNRELRSATDWLVPFVLGSQRALDAALFFFHRAFEVPRPETLLHVSDHSVAAYEESLAVSATTGVLALWLGYHDPAFLRQLVETVFCRHIASQQTVPGTTPADFRFSVLDSQELGEIVQVARALNGLGGPSGQPRVARKLGRQFLLKSLEVAAGVELGGKEAA
jgi:hypothetical protein